MKVSRTTLVMGLLGVAVASSAALSLQLRQSVVPHSVAKMDSAENVLGSTMENTSNYQLSAKILSQKRSQSGEFDHVRIQAKIMNNSSQALLVSPGLQTWLVTAAGERIPYTADFLKKSETTGGSVAANESLDIVLDYKISPNSSPKTLLFQADAASLPIEVNF